MSCGPTNALQKLSNHAQLDRSLHADQQLRQGSQGPGSFRTQTGNQLDAEFQQHVLQNQQPQNFNPVFQQGFHHQGQLDSHRINQQQQHHHQAGGWANDFAALSITNSGRTQHQQPAQQSNDWSSQFMMHGSQQQNRHQAQVFHQPQLHLNQANQMLHSQLHQQPQTFRTEHKEIHDLDQFHNDLESEFSKLEEEFASEPIQQEPVLKRNQNEQFKSVAQEVVNVMNTSNDSKFANSKFLQLMSMVSAGTVELNDDESKLVDEEGKDIHEQKLAESDQASFNFLNTHNAHGGDIQNDYDSSAFERTQRDAEVEELLDTNNHNNQKLPDPLEGLTAEDLSSPYNAARRVGDLRREQYTWDDVYDDYKNDDSSF